MDATAVRNRQIPNEYILLGSCIAALMFAAAVRSPYFFYVLLRILICASSVFVARKQYAEKRPLWVWVFGAVGCPYNPVLPIRMSRHDWTVINILTAVFIASWIVLRVATEARTPHAKV